MVTIATELIEVKKDERGRKITPKAEREALVRACRESGLTQRAFARKEGIKYSTLTAWIQAVSRVNKPSHVSFAEVKPLPRAVSELTVQLPGGVLVRGADATEVARLVQLLRC